jgi:hypothetical protein
MANAITTAAMPKRARIGHYVLSRLAVPGYWLPPPVTYLALFRDDRLILNHRTARIRPPLMRLKTKTSVARRWFPAWREDARRESENGELNAAL